MLKLVTSKEPFWLDVLPGVRIQFLPVKLSAIIRARNIASDILKQDAENGDLAMIAFQASIAASGIVGWDGIGDADGLPLPPTPENIDRALEIWPLYAAVSRLYVTPALVLETEKNASAPLPSGTSAGALNIAATVPNGALPANMSSTDPEPMTVN